jgi:hypothetical protein
MGPNFGVKVKVKVALEQAKKATEGAEIQLYSFFSLGARQAWVFNATSRPPYPRKREAIQHVQKAGWAQGQSERLRKFLPQPGLDPQTVQAVASRYTDCAIPVRPEFQGNSGNTFVTDIEFPKTRSNFNEPNQASKEGAGPQPCC